MRRLWTDDEVTYLIKYNKRKPLKQIAKDLDRTLGSIENKIQELTAKGTKFKNRSKNEWTFEEDEILLNDFGRYNIETLLKKLKRTRSAINHRLTYLLGTCEVEQIADVYRIKSICEITGVHRATVNLMMNNGELKFIQFDKMTRLVNGDYFWKWLELNTHRINANNISEDVFDTLPKWYQDVINKKKRENGNLKTRWTEKEKAMLKFLLSKDMTYKEIALELGRSHNSVQKLASKIFLQKA